MGPSGCGKTTLLNVLSRRSATSGAKVMGDCYVNGTQIDNSAFERMTSYVEQEDALIGSLTVQETMKFAADLALPRYVSRSITQTKRNMLTGAAMSTRDRRWSVFTPLLRHSVSKARLTR